MAKKYELVEVDGMFGLLSEKISYAPEGDYQVFPARIGSEGQIDLIREGGWTNSRGDFITKDSVAFDKNGCYEPSGKTHYLGKRMSLEQFSEANHAVFTEQMEKFKAKHPDMPSNYSPSAAKKLERIGEIAIDGYLKFEKTERKLEDAYLKHTVNYLDSLSPGFKHTVDYLNRKVNSLFHVISRKVNQRIEQWYDEIDNKEEIKVEESPSSIKNFEQPPDSQIEAVRKNPSLLRQIKEPTPEICMTAISEDPRALSLVRDQSPVICLTAVKIDGNALQFVREQTPQICIEAVRQTGCALQYVKNQTPELCAEAIKQDPLALKYVKNPSMELCVEAVRHNRNAISFVPESFLPAVRQFAPEKGINKAAQKVSSRSSVDLVR